MDVSNGAVHFIACCAIVVVELKTTLFHVIVKLSHGGNIIGAGFLNHTFEVGLFGKGSVSGGEVFNGFCIVRRDGFVKFNMNFAKGFNGLFLEGVSNVIRFNGTRIKSVKLDKLFKGIFGAPLHRGASNVRVADVVKFVENFREGASLFPFLIGAGPKVTSGRGVGKVGLVGLVTENKVGVNAEGVFLVLICGLHPQVWVKREIICAAKKVRMSKIAVIKICTYTVKAYWSTANGVVVEH